MGNSIYHSALIYNRLVQLGLCQFFSKILIKHILAIMTAALTYGYRGKTTNFGDCSPCHCTTVAHFLNCGRWDDTKLEDILKGSVIQTVYGEALRFGKPVLCIVDDTIALKTKPSSRALHPIEDAYFYQFHLKHRQDYGHQTVSVMLSCNGLALDYAVIMYDKTRSKIQIVQDIAKELPVPPFSSFFLCDGRYTFCRCHLFIYRERLFCHRCVENEQGTLSCRI